MLSKIVVIALLVAIVAAVLLAGVFLVRDPATSRRTLRALTWRVSLQVALILFLVLAYFMGWIHPHGLMQTR
jgi:hypothetical protein